MADLDALRTLVAVGQTGSLSAAARELGVTQQAVSARLRTLESSLSSVLVQRSARGSLLTPTGVIVAGWAREVLAAADRFDQSALTLTGGRDKTLRLAASLTIAEPLVPRWLNIWRARVDEIPGVRLTAENSETVCRRLRDGDADLGFIETPDLPGDLDHVVVGQDELVLVVAPTHPWATRAEIAAPELARTPLVLRESGSGTRRALDAALQSAGTPRLADPAAELPSTLAVRGTVRGGFHAAVLSALAVDTDLAEGALVAVPVRGVMLRRALTAVWPRTGLTGAARSLLEAISGS